MKKAWVCAFAVGICAQAGWAGDSLPVIGKDKDGKVTATSVTMEDYSARIRNVVGSVHGAALSALSTRRQESAWQLNTVIIGVGLGFEGGLGPIVSASVEPRIRLVFTQGDEPVIP